MLWEDFRSVQDATNLLVVGTPYDVTWTSSTARSLANFVHLVRIQMQCVKVISPSELRTRSADIAHPSVPTTATPPLVSPACPAISMRLTVQQGWMRSQQRFFLDNLDLLREMCRHCVICHQFASTNQMKHRYRQSHSTFYEENSQRIADFSSKWGVVANPCAYCGVSKTQARGHLSKCTALWQCAALHVWFLQTLTSGERHGQLHGFRGTDSRVLRVPGPVPDQARSCRRDGSCGGACRREGKAAGKHPGKGRGTMATRSRPSGVSSSPGQDLEKLVDMVARLSLRHESTLQVLRQDTAYVMWARLSSPSVVATMIAAAKKWKDMAGDASQQHKMLARLPMRILQQLVDLVRKDVTHLKTDPSVRQGFKDSSGNWNFQVWNRELQALEVDTTRPPMPQGEVLQLLEHMIKQATQQAINRFHATRPLTDNMTGEVVTLLLDLSVRHPAAAELYHALGKLQGNAVFQLIGIQYRKEGLRHTPLARQLMESAWFCESWQSLLRQLYSDCLYVDLSSCRLQLGTCFGSGW